MSGRIKKLEADRGFGFLAGEDGKDYFFHRSGVDSSVNFEELSVGDAVDFSIEPSDRGPRAARVRRI